MKKTLLTLFMAFAAICGMAQTTYNEKLVVDINGTASDSIPATISVTDNGDGTCSFSLKNFKLIDGEDELPVGNIQLEGVTISTEGGISTLQTKQEIKIAEGDDSSIDWAGPALGIVPIDLQGKLTADHMYAVLNIDMREAMDQMIKVTVGQEANIVAPAPAPAEGTIYNEKLIVDINGAASDSIPAVINVVDNGDGTCGFSLKNFKLIDGEDTLPVGNIQLDNVAISTVDGISTISTDQSITIEAGDESEEYWIGPDLGLVPIKLEGKLTDTHMYAVLSIDMSESLQQIIKVTVGQETNIVAPAPAPTPEAKIYDEKLVININGVSTDSIPATINLTDNGDGTCSFSLKNFKLIDGEDILPVGNIQLDNVAISTVDGISTISTDQSITIEAGDESEEYWVGPDLGIVPIKLEGKLTDTHMYAVLSIDMSESLQQIIKVTVGQEDKVTTIKGIEIIPTAKSQTIYTLDGRRVSNATKGVYIINGKKVIK